ncbi:hypothetical protein UlMin_046190 [Ulmus minor]
MYKGRLCIPDYKQLRNEILYDAHNTPYSVHPGTTKMYQDLKKHYWWHGMKRDVAKYVEKCLTCQQVKAEHQRPGGELQPIKVPEWKWEEIAMDFIVGLPKTTNKYDSIWVVVDRLTKSAHFLPVRTTYTADQLAELYVHEIVRLHGVPLSIISDRDSRFTAAWHHTKPCMGESVDHRYIAQSRQKSYADKRRRPLEFNKGDHVFLKVAPMKRVMRFGKKGKLSPRFIGPYEILERIGKTAYQLALPPSLSAVHNVFHVSMLKKYVHDPSHVLQQEPVEIDEKLSYEERPVEILDRKSKELMNKTIHLVKVLWRNHTVEEATWEREDEM